MRLSKKSGVVGLLGLALLGSTAAAVPADTGAGVENSIETRQFRIENAQLPVTAGQHSTRQSVLAWQVTQGTWNGQNLDGLSIVFVQSTSDTGRSAAQASCYISHEASQAQRDALLSAFFAAQPQLAPVREGLRIEPAVISVEVEGQSVVLHLGLIA